MVEGLGSLKGTVRDTENLFEGPRHTQTGFEIGDREYMRFYVGSALGVGRLIRVGPRGHPRCSPRVSSESRGGSVPTVHVDNTTYILVISVRRPHKRVRGPWVHTSGAAPRISSHWV